jgi:hypothetical protein
LEDGDASRLQQGVPKGYEAMISLEGAVRSSGLEPLLLELVKLRLEDIGAARGA